LGRLLPPTVAGSTVSISEEAAGLPFGFAITGASATGAGLAASGPTGSPATASVTVNAPQPKAGDTVSFDLKLNADGSTQTVTLTANANGSGGAGTFAIGATPAATADNIRAALQNAVSVAASTTLTAASALTASNDFFAGSISSPPMRVVPPPPPATLETATSYASGTSADTVIWYRGDDSPDSPRATAPVQVGDNQSVAIGLRANEPGLRALLAGFGALAGSSFPETDPNVGKHYDALSGRLASVLLGPGGAPLVDAMNVDLGIASATLSMASERVTATKAQVQTLADAVDTVSPEKVAAELIATQTQLQASYQTTSTIAKMSLVNYL
jgi:flagellin-like hook-associated protein FlgL